MFCLIFSTLRSLLLHRAQELRCQENELIERKRQQQEMQEILMKKQKELEARELDLVERELHLMIPSAAPVPKKRRGKVSNKLLKVSDLHD